ncbi:unnamed protein product [Linum trigynum]|uniref:Uncharacterized protein n=1 Tax=Linum trigynum TaxID=586398 RepID=A0AAV2D8F5_9ROSI
MDRAGGEGRRVAAGGSVAGRGPRAGDRVVGGWCGGRKASRSLGSPLSGTKEGAEEGCLGRRKALEEGAEDTA